MKKKRSEEMQTLRAGCSKAEPKNVRRAADPLPGSTGRPKKTAGDGHYLYVQTQFGEDRRTLFRVIVVTVSPSHTNTHPPTHTQTDRTDYNTQRRSWRAV